MFWHQHACLADKENTSVENPISISNISHSAPTQDFTFLLQLTIHCSQLFCLLSSKRQFNWHARKLISLTFGLKAIMITLLFPLEFCRIMQTSQAVSCSVALCCYPLCYVGNLSISPLQRFQKSNGNKSGNCWFYFFFTSHLFVVILQAYNNSLVSWREHFYEHYSVPSLKKSDCWIMLSHICLSKQ